MKTLAALITILMATGAPAAADCMVIGNVTNCSGPVEGPSGMKSSDDQYGGGGNWHPIGQDTQPQYQPYPSVMPDGAHPQPEPYQPGPYVPPYEVR